MATGVIATEIFLDTAYAIALFSPHGSFYHRAILLAEIEAEAVGLINIKAQAMSELGNALIGTKHGQEAALLLEALNADESAEIAPLTNTLRGRAFQLFRRYADKAWA